MGPAARALTAVALVAGLACGGDEPAVEPGGSDTAAGSVALPPSADVPRATVPGGGPDTLRPEPDTLGADTLGLDPDRRRDPREFDLRAVVDTYRRHYADALAEEGSDLVGRVDPELAEDARRRVALDWGYVDIGAWEDMVDDMTRDQRIVLEREIEAANRELAARLHSGPPPGPGPPEGTGDRPR